MSAVKIERVEGLVVHVSNLDLLDGTPVLDLKPYVPYADAHPRRQERMARAERSASGMGDLLLGSRADAQLAWLSERGVDLTSAIVSALALGPQPHAYRRIRKHGDGMRLAIKDWRVDFVVDGRRIEVLGVASGYRAKELETRPDLELHRAFVASSRGSG